MLSMLILSATCDESIYVYMSKWEEKEDGKEEDKKDEQSEETRKRKREEDAATGS